MKSTIFALTAFAVSAKAGLHDVDPKVAADVHVRNLPGPDINLPAGIHLPGGVTPSGPPPEGCTNVFHPAHVGIDIDGCDCNDNGWHWVHPGQSHPEQPPYAWTTSTVFTTDVSTVISCAATITNCPARSTIYTTQTIAKTTTICPVLASESSAWIPTSTAAPSTWSSSACPTTGHPVITSAPAAPPAPAPPAPAAPTTHVWTAPAAPPAAPPAPAPPAPAVAPSHVVPGVAPVGTGNSTMPHPSLGQPLTAGASKTVQCAGFAAILGLAVALL